MTTRNELPEVDDNAATICVGSDRYPATVIARTAKTITLRHDDYEANKEAGHEYYGRQVYRYFENPNGQIDVARMTKHGWRVKGTPVSVGRRNHFSDPSF